MSNSTVTTLDDASKPDAQAQAQAQAKPKAAVVKGNNNSGELSGKRVTITIAAEQDELGGEAVVVGLNGVLYQIPRGEPQSVPVEVVKVLSDAKRDFTHTGPGGVPVTREVRRYNFQVEVE